MAKAKENSAVLTIPALVVTPNKAPAVSGNFEMIKVYLQTWKKKVLDMKITEENMAEVRTIKKEAVQYRNSLAKIQTDTKKLYFNDPKAVFDAQMNELLKVVGDVETEADKVLAVEEQQRTEEINKVLNHYRDKFQEQYKLDDQHYAHLEYKKDYYNKTVPKGYSSMDKYWKESLETQFKELKKTQDAHAASIRLITAACKDEPRLNLQHWINQLQYDDVATITEAIIAEKNRLHELDTQPAQTTTASSGGVQDADYEVVDSGTATAAAETSEKVVLGIPSTINFDSDFQGRTKSISIQLTYPCDLGDALTELFKSLRSHGIKIKQLAQKEEVF